MPILQQSLEKTILATKRTGITNSLTVDGKTYQTISRNFDFFSQEITRVSSIGAGSRENIIFDEERYSQYLSSNNNSLEKLKEQLLPLLKEASYSREFRDNFLLLVFGLVQSIVNPSTYPDGSDATLKRLQALIDSKKSINPHIMADPILYFEDIMNADAKICRHAAIESAFLLKYLLKYSFFQSALCKQMFENNLSIHNFRDVTLAGGHAWTIIKSKDNRIYFLLDPTWNTILDLNNEEQINIVIQKYGLNVYKNIIKTYGNSQYIKELQKKAQQELLKKEIESRDYISRCRDLFISMQQKDELSVKEQIARSALTSTEQTARIRIEEARKLEAANIQIKSTEQAARADLNASEKAYRSQIKEAKKLDVVKLQAKILNNKHGLTLRFIKLILALFISFFKVISYPFNLMINNIHKSKTIQFNIDNKNPPAAAQSRVPITIHQQYKRSNINSTHIKAYFDKGSISSSNNKRCHRTSGI